MISNEMLGIQDRHLNTSLVFRWSEYQTIICPVFKWQSNTGLLGDWTILIIQNQVSLVARSPLLKHEVMPDTEMKKINFVSMVLWPNIAYYS